MTGIPFQVPSAVNGTDSAAGGRVSCDPAAKPGADSDQNKDN